MTRDDTLIQMLVPTRSLARNALLILAGSLAVGLGAQVDVPMYPVPMSLQTLVISAIGLTYGARLAGLTLLAYLVEGAVGLPVFAGGGAGVAHLFGPTFGYLIGFVAMAWMTGLMVERGFNTGLLRLFVAALVPTALLFVPGVLWLWAVLPLSLSQATAVGATPFLIGGLVKALMAALVVTGGWTWLERRKG